MELFDKVIEAGKIFEMQRMQYQERLLLKGLVNPQTTQQLKVSIGNLGHFLCQEITGNFTTVAVKAGTVLQDTGIVYTYGKLQDATGQRDLFNDYIPLDLILSPGRTRANMSLFPGYSIGFADIGGPSNNLFYPTKFQYLFYSNSEIILDVKNVSDAPNFINLAFHGVRVRTKAGGR